MAVARMKLLTLICFAFLSACATSTPKTIDWDKADEYVQDPMVFKLTKANQLVYVVGTAHVAIKDIPERLKKLILESEYFISEGTLIDTDSPLPPRIPFSGEEYKVSPEAMASAIESLHGAQSQEALKKLSAFELWLKVDENLRAWEQVNEELRNNRPDPEASASGSAFFDTRLEQFAKETGVKLDALESFTSEALQRCEELTSVVFLERLAFDRGYQKNPKVLERASSNMDDACIQKRNLAWMKILDGLTPDHKRLFIAVGLAHLVLKEPNLITLFKERGFSVELIQNLPAQTKP
jgi:uncharacterized protein YbaP (TraB family)